MGEALEKWDLELLRSVVPEICDIIEKIDTRLKKEHPNSGLFIIKDHQAHMANLSVYVSTAVNGVARIHSRFSKTTCSRTGTNSTPSASRIRPTALHPGAGSAFATRSCAGSSKSKVGTGF